MKPLHQIILAFFILAATLIGGSIYGYINASAELPLIIAMFACGWISLAAALILLVKK